MSDIYKATKNKVVDSSFEKPDVYKATSNKQVDPQISIKNKTQTFALNSMPFPSGTLTPSKMNTQIQQNLGSGTNKPPVHPVINDDYKQFRYDSLKLDTLKADLSKAGDAVKTAYSGWQDKKSMESLKPTIENAYNRLKMLDSYNADYGDGSIDVSAQVNAYKSILDEWDEIAETYGEYDSSQEYDKAIKTYNETVKNNKKDLKLYDKEIKDLENIIKTAGELQAAIPTNPHPSDSEGAKLAEERYNKFLEYMKASGYKSTEEMHEALKKLKLNKNQASRYQALQKLSSVIDKASENYDKNAEKYIKKGKETDFRKVGQEYTKDYLYQEGVTIGPTYVVDDLRAAAIALAEHNGTPKTETNGDNYRNVKKYRHLKENEFEVFAYYLGKDMETGGNQAREYLNMMDETLKTRMGTETYEKYLKDNALLETLYAVPVGLDQFASGVTNLFNTKDDYIPVSSTQVAGQLAREDLRDAGFKLPKWLGGSSFGQGVYDVLSTTANMAPSILVSAVANYVVPGSGAYVGGTLMGASAAGNAYQEALNNGMDKSQARTYSTLVGVSEAALSALLSKAMGGKALEGKLKDAINGIDNKLLKFAANYGTAFVSEGAEEGLQEILTPIFENIALGYNKNGFEDIDWGEVAYSALLGGLSGGNFEVIGGVANRVKGVNYVKKVYGAGITTDNLINLGLSLPTESKAYKYAKQLDGAVNSGKKVSSNKLYNLVIATENFVADRLNQLGESGNVAAVSSAVIKKLSGVELSVSEIELLSKSAHGQEVLSTIVPKAESTPTTETFADSQNSQLQSQDNGGIINQGGADNVNKRTFEPSIEEIRKQYFKRKDKKQSRRSKPETAEAFAKRTSKISVEGSGEKRTLLINGKSSIAYIPSTKDAPLNRFVEKLKAIGIEAYCCSGPIETNLNNITTIHYDAFTSSKGRMFFNDSNDFSNKQKADHELAHLALSELDESYLDYEDIIISNLLYESNYYIAFCFELNEREYNNQYNVSLNGNIEDAAAFNSEIAAYVYQMVLNERTFADEFFSNMFKNWEDVTDAVATFNSAMKIDTKELIEADTEVPANFMPENENTALESGEYGLTEPSDQEIYRDTTEEENRGKRKNAKQRHILDVAKKLDSGMKVVFVAKGSNVLKGKNGKYNRDTNTIYIAEGLSTVEMYAEVFKHEFVHRLELRKAYDSFKKYLFNKSEAFGDYAQARLALNDNGDVQRTREQAINELVDMYLNNVKNDKTLSQEYKKNFTREKAEREAVADFIARTLFKDKNKDFLQALKDKNLPGFMGAETDLDLFGEMANKDRNLLQKIIDAIKDLIASLKGMPNIEKDLRYIEERLTRVYQSAENKKTATESGGIEFYNDVLHSKDSKFIIDAIKENVVSIPNENVFFVKNEVISPDIKKSDYVLKIFESQGKIAINKNIGKVELARSGAKSTVFHGFGPEKLAATKAIKNVIENGTIIKQTANYNGSDVDRYVIAAKGEIENQPAYIGVIVKTYPKQKNSLAKFYLHEAVIIKMDSPIMTAPQLSVDAVSESTTNNISNFAENVKQKQLDIILKTNPAPNIYQTWVRSVDDIHTWDEVLDLNDEREGQFVWGDFSRADAEKALKDGTITIYSSYPIKNGVFVSSSYIQAQEYAGGKNGKVYSKTVPLENVAWINGDEGQYAEVGSLDNESFSSDDLSDLQRDLYNRHKNGEITREEYLEKTDELWGKANETHGMLPQGENAKAPIATPAAVAEDKPTERFTRTIIETGKLSEEMLQGMEEKVLLGDFSYKVISDEKALQKADSAIKNGTAEDIWESAVNDGKRINKNEIAVGEQLLKDAIESGNTKRVLELSAELADIFTRAGQVVQAARLLKKMTGAGRLVSAQRTIKTINNDLRAKYGEDFPPVKISPESAKRLAEAKTAGGIEYAYQEIMQEVAAQVPVTFMDKWNAWRYFAMLSNPKTHIRNLVGNGIFVPAVVIKDALAVGMETAIVKDSSKKTKSLIVKKEYYGFAIKDAKDKGVKNLLKGNKYNDKTAIREKQRIFKNEALEFLTNFNSNALEAEDMLFKNIHYIHALAGFLQARKVDLKNVDQDVLDEARIYAVKEAKKATFNDESALANAIQRFGSKNLATNMAVEGVLPFKRTPINIIKRGIEYSPIGLIKTATKGLYDVKKGKISLTECIDGFASGLTGTGLLALGMVLSGLGAITGGEDDDDKSQFEKWLGKQEYAVEIGGKSYTVDWAAPANIPFFIGVEIANIGRNEEDFTFANVFNTMWNALEPITNLSMLSGIQSVIESARYAEPSQVISSIAVDALTSYGMQGVPSLFGATARTIDPTQRSWYTDKNDKWLDATAQTIKNNVQSKIPGLSYTQIPKIDMWGREVSRGGVGERILENFISPGYYSKIEYTETSEELKRIFKKTDIDVFPNIAAKSFEIDGKMKYLTADEYVTYAKAKGTYSFDYLKEFMETSSYKNLTDVERADVIQGLYKYSNAKAKTTVSNYDLMKQFKTVTNWERSGKSAVDYYIHKAISK